MRFQLLLSKNVLGSPLLPFITGVSGDSLSKTLVFSHLEEIGMSGSILTLTLT